MDDQAWISFVHSGVPPVTAIATLEDSLRRAISTSAAIIRIRHDYALKICHKHKLSIDEFMMLPRSINLGRAVLDDNNPERIKHLSFFYRETGRDWYHAAVKTTLQGSELWIRTFHRSDDTDVKRICNRGQILRNEVQI